MSTGFVPVDAVFADEGVDILQLSAGERLRDAREKSGLSLDEAATQTRIRKDYLEAIETMDPRGLPARAYAIGYLRTYASFLALDSVAIVDQFKREVDTETGRAQPTAAAQTRREIKLPRGVFGAAMILASVAAVAFWYAEQAGNDTGLTNMPSPPDAAPAWAREDFAADRQPVSVADIWSDLPLGTATVAQDVIMRATAPTWFEVRDASGRVLFARELAAGEAYRAQEDGLTVSARNAGAIQLEVDGEIVGSLGEEGLSIENQPVLAQVETAQGEP